MTEYRVKVNNLGTRWYKRNTNILHREDGPAVEYADGGKEWYINNKIHREDGPAIEYADGYKAWFINGEKLTEDEFNNRNKTELTLDEIAAKFGVDVKDLKIKK